MLASIMSKRVVVFGMNGQVGRALMSLLPAQGYEPLGVDRNKIDLVSTQKIAPYLNAAKPNWVINAAAYTDVNRAETFEDQAMAINDRAPQAMAEWCRKQNVPFISYSTDYVFNGMGQSPNTELTAPGPLNAYGRSKLAGEESIASAGGHWMIFRSSWIYSEKGKNFLLTMLRAGLEKVEINVVNDQWGTPTFACDQIG